jgi:hypothetical protein
LLAVIKLFAAAHLPQEGPAGCHKLVVDEPLRQQPIIIAAQLAAARVHLQTPAEKQSIEPCMQPVVGLR